MLALALSISLIAQPVTLEVDRLERNHFGDASTQYVFWDWCSLSDTWRCQGWVMADKCGDRLPVKQNGKYRIGWREDGRRYRLAASTYSETWTINDPEVEDRGKYPQAWRLLDRLRKKASK